MTIAVSTAVIYPQYGRCRGAIRTRIPPTRCYIPSEQLNMLSKPIEYSYRVLSTYLAVKSVGVCMSTGVCNERWSL